MASSGASLALCSNIIPNTVAYGSTFLIGQDRPKVACNVNGTLTTAKHRATPDCAGDWASCRDACLYTEQQYGTCAAFGFDSSAAYASDANQPGGDCYLYGKGPAANGLVKKKKSTRGFYSHQCFEFESCNSANPRCANKTPYYSGCGARRDDPAYSKTFLSNEYNTCEATDACSRLADDLLVDQNTLMTNFVISLIQTTLNERPVKRWKCDLYSNSVDKDPTFDGDYQVLQAHGYNYKPCGALDPDSTCSGPDSMYGVPYYTGCGVERNSPMITYPVDGNLEFCDAIQSCRQNADFYPVNRPTYFALSYLQSTNEWRCQLFSNAENDTSQFAYANDDVKTVNAFSYSPSATSNCYAVDPGVSDITPYYVGCGMIPSVTYLARTSKSYTVASDAIVDCASQAAANSNAVSYYVSKISSRSYACTLYDKANVIPDTADIGAVAGWSYNLPTNAHRCNNNLDFSCSNDVTFWFSACGLERQASDAVAEYSFPNSYNGPLFCDAMASCVDKAHTTEGVTNYELVRQGGDAGDAVCRLYKDTYLTPTLYSQDNDDANSVYAFSISARTSTRG